ncbi:hypothetical protein PTUN_a2193 [Pseudoalteromonas tunicata]|nr:hypothetical protein PTUN_a2193 [Pseudoalteromonas tunicata]
MLNTVVLQCVFFKYKLFKLNEIFMSHVFSMKKMDIQLQEQGKLVD